MTDPGRELGKAGRVLPDKCGRRPAADPPEPARMSLPAKVLTIVCLSLLLWLAIGAVVAWLAGLF